MAELELIALANARKQGGRVVLGWCESRGFVRLLSPRGGGALSPYDVRFTGAGQLTSGGSDGDEPRVFDLMRVGVVGQRALPHQPENWLIDESPWKLVRRPAPRRLLERLLPLLERGPGLLGGLGVAVPFRECARHSIASSVAITRPQHAVLSIVDRLGRRRVRLQFQLNGGSFELTVTDPRWEQAVALWQPGEYPWWKVIPSGRPPLVTVSLTEPFGDTASCYKVVANLWPGPEMLGAVAPKPQPPAEWRRWGRSAKPFIKPTATNLPLVDGPDGRLSLRESSV